MVASRLDKLRDKQSSPHRPIEDLTACDRDRQRREDTRRKIIADALALNNRQEPKE